MIKTVSESLSLVHTLDRQGVAITFSNREADCNETKKISYKGSKKGIPIRFWGRDNNLPQYREQLLSDNNIAGTLVQTKRDINFGTGLFAYKRVFVSDGGKVNTVEVPIPDEAQLFFDKVDIDEYLLSAGKELFMHANVFTEFTRNNGGQIDQMVVKECKYTRLGEQSPSGVIDRAYISGSWATRDYQKDGETEFDRLIVPIQMYNKNEEKKQDHFILQTGDSFFNDGYYNSPTWFGSKGWIELANSIVLFHQANILNGYTIRVHIEVPKGYFYTAPDTDAAEGINKARTDAENRKAEFLKSVNELLAGVSNTGRALFTEYDISLAIGTQYPGIKITPLSLDLKDEALLKLFESSNQANISAQGIHPTLANVENQGKLSSGSEMRMALQTYIATKTATPRRILLKPINLVKQINGWPKDIYFGFGDMEITTLDVNPTGMNKDAVTVPDTGAPAKN